MSAARTAQFRRAGAAVVLAVLGAAAAAPAVAGVEEGRAKAAVCVACHGEGGNSTNPKFPSISAQPKQFLVSALFYFREGNRKDPLMSPMAANLSNTDLNDLAAYFSAQKMANPAVQVSPEVAAAGARIAAQQNCTACHATNLMGQQHIPRLAGQQKEYLIEQLRGFKASTRYDSDGIMTSAAQALTPQDIETLGASLAALHPVP